MSYRVTIPDKYVAPLMLISEAMELRVLAEQQETKARKKGHTSLVQFWKSIRLAVIDALDEHDRLAFAKEQGHGSK